MQLTASRLDEWSDAHWQTLTIASLMPPPLSLDLLTAVTTYSPIKALKILEDLVNRDVLRTYEPAGIGHYCFSDPTLPSTILNSQDKMLVTESAQLLIHHVSESNLPPDEISLTIANIYFMADLASRAVEHILRAGGFCVQHGAYEAAAVYYRMAMETCEQSVQSTETEEFLIDSAIGLVSACGHCTPLSEQRETLSKAQIRARKLNDRVRLCKIDLFLGEIAKSAGDYAAAGDLFEEAWDFASLLNDDAMRKKTALVTADFLFLAGKGCRSGCSL